VSEGGGRKALVPTIADHAPIFLPPPFLSFTLLPSLPPPHPSLLRSSAEQYGIDASISPHTLQFRYPTNYPFQGYAARYPAPGTGSNFGRINNALFYSTVLGGKAKLITLNSYVPFHEGTPQHRWERRGEGRGEARATGACGLPPGPPWTPRWNSANSNQGNKPGE
jgi:hypothetical protein